MNKDGWSFGYLDYMRVDPQECDLCCDLCGEELDGDGACDYCTYPGEDD